jgi:para-aminobenzoate synthetase component 1
MISNFCFLNNNGYDFDKSYECIAGIGAEDILKFSGENDFESLNKFQQENKDWIFGHVNYDLKNQIEDLFSNHFDGIGSPDFVFFVPMIVVIISQHEVSIGVLESDNSDELFHLISSTIPKENTSIITNLKSRFSEREYLETVAQLQDHIARGDCYEVCLCQEFYAEDATISPISVFEKLNKLSPNPFSAFYKNDSAYLMCASPERFLKKQGKEIISQPIKGTLRRENKSEEGDEKEIQTLRNDEKERAENTMIVDLVRNDLTKICEIGSVKVKEFLEIYSFPQVHQMISTISGQLKDEISFGNILKATFPMGSMTGAPKKRAMELIEKYERTKRGLFSGTVGYISPQGNFDFNVVIRSIIYQAQQKYISIQVGSAITSKSIAQKEFEECMTKLEAMKKALL